MPTNGTKRLLAPAALCAVALTTGGAALAAGGATISGAPIVKAGAAESGDTRVQATGDGSIGSDLSPGCWTDVQYWRLPLVAGDQIVVKGTATSPAYHFQVGLFPAGTTDKNINSKVAAVSVFPTRGTIRFNASKTGMYALVFGPGCYDSAEGPYNFTVSVTKKH
ncbi:MAG TPA: hypothetical protein VGL76_04360 [Gaiellaceae bacterium]